MELNNLINIFGWVIINSLWQGLFIAILLSIALLLINPKHAKIRSMIAYASLLLVFAASIRTYSDLSLSSKKETQNNNYSLSNVNSDIIIFHDFQESASYEKSTTQSLLGDHVRSISNIAAKNLNYIVLLWLFGIFFLTLRMLGGYLYMQKIRTKKIYDVDEKWLKTVKSISEFFNITRPVILFESATVKFPTVIGYFKPVILMPLGTLAEMSTEQVEMILAHELAHIKRSDYLLNLVQSFLEIVYFFNPAVWIISRIIRTEREYACDDLALSINDDSLIMAKALLSVHQKEGYRPVVAISALGTKNSILWRIKRMIQKNNVKTNYPKKMVLSILLVGSLITLSVIACSATTQGFNDTNAPDASFMTFAATPTTPVIAEEVELPVEIVDFDKVAEIEPIKKIADIENGKRKFNFHKDETHWKGTVEDGKVVLLFKDGEKIAIDEIAKYEDFILDTLKEIDEEMAELEIDMKDFKLDMAQLKEDLKDIKIDLDLEQLDAIKEHFNSEEFHKDMEELKESLKDMKFEFNDEWKHELKEALKNKEDWDIDLEHFKSDEFKNEMKNLKHELEHLKDLDIDVHFDKESFKESMKELKESMKDLKVNMSDLDIDLDDLKVDLSDLKVEMKKLKAFIGELKTDLLNERYIDSTDEDFDMDLSKKEVTVNGKKLPENLHQRYLNLYKEHFGKELDDNFRINN